MKKLLLYIIALTAAAGCNKVPDQLPPQGEEATVNFDVTLPPQKNVDSRAYSDIDVINIDVLIFDENAQFIERVSIDEITGTGSEKKFSLRMNFTQQPRTFHIVANGRGADGTTDRINFSDLTVGMAEATAIPRLKTTASSVTEATITPLVMWGRVAVTAINTTIINITDAKLIRSQAAITVSKADGVSFTISEASLYGVPDFGSVAPSAYSSSTVVPTTPSIPTGVQMVNGYAQPGPNPVLYTYERENTSANHLSVIILGIYGGQQRYYRVVLADENKTFMHVVRNHRYNIKIVKAEGYGYSTIAEALANPPSNLKVEITDERDDILFITADGGNEIGTSINHIHLWGEGSGSIDLAKIYSSLPSPSVTITHPSLSTGGLANQGNGMYHLSSMWSGKNDNSGTITVTVGALKQTIQVESKDLSSLYNNGNTISLRWLLGEEANKPWSVRIIQNTDRARLATHDTEMNFSTLWGASSMDSSQSSTVYLHVLMRSDLTDRSRVIVEYSKVVNGALHVGRIFITE